jgi:hypothetical protein
MFRLFSIVVAVCAWTALTPVASAVGAPYCRQGESPAFHFGFAALSGQLGKGMGSPIECEHGSGALTVQLTTSGFAYYVPWANISVFTVTFLPKPYYNFSLGSEGLIFWRGETVEPPADAVTVTTDCFDAHPTGYLAVACGALFATQLGDPFSSAPTLPPTAPVMPAPSFIAPAPASSAVDTYIDGEFAGWDGETVFRLQNGQIWQQAVYAYMYSYAYSPRVLIYQAGGGWRMQIEGVTDTLQVQRLR